MDDWHESTWLSGCDAAFVGTPWRHARELVALREQLFGAEELGRERAVELIFAWETRNHVPLPVLTTALLTQAQLFDKPAAHSYLTIRMVYCTAVIRFVTSICDAFQPRASEKLPMHTVGMLLGLPAKLVDVRHDATHKEFPTMERLREASKEALAWLKERYWKSIDQVVEEKDKENPALKSAEDLRAELRVVLKAYLATRKTEIKKRGASSQAGTEASVACVRICAGLKSHRNVLAELLVDVKMLIPANRQLDDSLSGAFLLWNPFLLRLSILSPALLASLITHMLTILNAQTPYKPTLDSQKEAMYFWLAHILTSEQWTPVQRALKEFSDLQHLVLSECFTACTHWGRKLVEDILEHVEDDVHEDWAPVLEAVQAEGGEIGDLKIRPSDVELAVKALTEEQAAQFMEKLPAGWARWTGNEAHARPGDVGDEARDVEMI